MGGSEELRTMQDERQIMRRKVPGMRVALDVERQVVSDLERKVEEARAQAKREQERALDAQRTFLLQRAKKIALEKERFVHTCAITSATATKVRISFRGGAS